ncbi:hypothetical protein HK098_000717 [Nowakowskiella sp. JEL0407]|nr:hypothetical protein HK098_000717 [Nowakowskiella sp. JEL0407]
MTSFNNTEESFNVSSPSKAFDPARELSLLCSKLHLKYSTGSFPLKSSNGFLHAVIIEKEVISPTSSKVFKTEQELMRMTSLVALQILRSDETLPQTDPTRLFLKMCGEREDIEQFQTRYEVNAAGLKRIFVGVLGKFFGGDKWYLNYADARRNAIETAYDSLTQSGSNAAKMPLANISQKPEREDWKTRLDTILKKARQHREEKESTCASSTSDTKIAGEITELSQFSDNSGKNKQPEKAKDLVDIWNSNSLKKLWIYCRQKNLNCYLPQVRKSRKGFTVDIRVAREVFSVPLFGEGYKTEAIGVEKTASFALELLSDDALSDIGDVVHVFSVFCTEKLWTASTRGIHTTKGKKIALSLKEKYMTDSTYTSYAMARRDAFAKALLDLDQDQSFQESYYRKINGQFAAIAYPLTLKNLVSHSVQQPDDANSDFYFRSCLQQIFARLRIRHSFEYAVDSYRKYCCAVKLFAKSPWEANIYGQKLFDTQESAADALASRIYHSLLDTPLKDIYAILPKLRDSDTLWSKCKPIMVSNLKRKSDLYKLLINIAAFIVKKSKLSEGKLKDGAGKFLSSVVASDSKCNTSRSSNPGSSKFKEEIINSDNMVDKISTTANVFGGVHTSTVPSGDDVATLSPISTIPPSADSVKFPSALLLSARNITTNRSDSPPPVPLLLIKNVPSTNHFPLHHACAVGDFESILELSNDITIRQPDLFNRYPIHYFCSNRDPSLMQTQKVEEAIWKLTGYSESSTLDTAEILAKQDNSYLTPLAISLAIDAQTALEAKRSRCKAEFLIPEFRDNKPKVYVSLTTQVLLDLNCSLNIIYPGSSRTCWHGVALEIKRRLDGKLFTETELLALGSDLMFVLVTWVSHGLDVRLKDGMGETGWDVLHGFLGSENTAGLICKAVKEVEEWAADK